MRYFSTFTGIGGFEFGIERAFELLNEEKPECVGYSEIDPYAGMIYKHHYPHHINYGDITKIDERTLPEFELFVGGFPCQSFSIAGKRGGFEDTRGTMFFEIARILRAKQPHLFVLENVKGLLSHDEGRTFRTIIITLDELGYDLQWQVLNSKNFGVPQNRERVFIVGNLRGKRRPEVFPITDRSEPLESSTCLDANYWKGADKHGQRTLIELTQNESDASRVYDSRGIAKTLKGLGGGMGAKTGLYKIFDLKTTQGSTRRGAVSEREEVKTLDTDCLQAIEVQSSIRRLTPIECERLQGFPDNWTRHGQYRESMIPVPISDTQRYKCCGNAVTTNVVCEIIFNIFK